jgi:SLOG-like protein
MNDRPLSNLTVSLSISESDDSARRGFPVWQVNRVTLQVTASLFGQGASLVFGHDWRDDGVMQAIHGFAMQVQPPVPLSPAETQAAGHPLLKNILPWPDKPVLSDEDLERLASTLRVEEAGLPAEIKPFDSKGRAVDTNDPLYRYLRARGLTHLRRRLNAESEARFCIGGRTEGSAGRYPGVIEEALLAIQEGKPLFLAGLLGGAARQVISAIEEQEMPTDFCRSGLIDELFKKPPIVETDRQTQADRLSDRKRVWTAFQEIGVTGLARTNFLSAGENRELFYTPVFDRVMELVLTGLSRIPLVGS